MFICKDREICWAIQISFKMIKTQYLDLNVSLWNQFLVLCCRKKLSYHAQIIQCISLAGITRDNEADRSSLSANMYIQQIRNAMQTSNVVLYALVMLQAVTHTAKGRSYYSYYSSTGQVIGLKLSSCLQICLHWHGRVNKFTH